MQSPARAMPEVVLRTLFLTVFLFLLFSCGVKVLPIAPERTAVKPIPNLNCSPLEADCDATDPHYQPQGLPKAVDTSPER